MRLSAERKISAGSDTTYNYSPGSARQPEKGRRKVRIAAFAIAAVTLTGCAPDKEETRSDPTEAAKAETPEPSPTPEMQSFVMGDRRYTIPAEYITAIRIGGEDSFVRIRIPDFPAEIVVDENSSGKTDEAGAPQIFSINDKEYPRLEYSRRDNEEAIVCRVGMASQSGCGTLFEYGGMRWTLLFPLGMEGRTDNLVKEAKKLLDLYTDGAAEEVRSYDEESEEVGSFQ